MEDNSIQADIVLVEYDIIPPGAARVEEERPALIPSQQFA